MIPPVSVTSQARNELFALAVRPWVAAKLGVAPLTNAMLVVRTTADSVAVGRSQPRQTRLPGQVRVISHDVLPSLSFVLLLLTWTRRRRAALAAFWQPELAIDLRAALPAASPFHPRPGTGAG